MKKLYPLFYISLFLICLSSCKIDAPVFPEKPDKPNKPDTTATTDTTKTQVTINTALLTGWWQPTVNTKSTIYFGTDNFFFQDTLKNDVAPTGGFWRTGHDTIKYSTTLNAPASANFIVNKLTADSLIVTLTGVKTAYHKINRPIITSTAISTIAGIGLEGLSGDGAAATAAQLSATAGLTVDKNGNVYFCDRHNQVIRKINVADGKISTIAGARSGVSGPYVDNSPALSVNLADPAFILADSLGNLYVSESEFIPKIDKISADGKIKCIASCNISPPAIGNGDGGLATAASLNSPQGMALDAAGNLYIAEASGRRIRVITAADGKINTYAGTGELGHAGDGGPAVNAATTALDIAFDTKGNMYISDYGNNYIRKVDAITKVITTIAGTGSKGSTGDGGPAINAKVNLPFGIKVAPNGNVFFTELQGGFIRKIDVSTGIITKVAGTGFEGYSGDGLHATAYSLNLPYGIAFDTAGNLYVGQEYRIRKIIAP